MVLLTLFTRGRLEESWSLGENVPTTVKLRWRRGRRQEELQPASRMRRDHLGLRCDCAEVEKDGQACAVEAEKGFAGSTCRAELPQPVSTLQQN